MPRFTIANAQEAARKSHASRHKRTDLKQALELQDLAYKAAVSMRVALSPGENFTREDSLAWAQMVKAWDMCADRARIFRGEPLPGSRRPVPEREKPSKIPMNKPPTLEQIMRSVSPGPG
jgi:hypothetical protein